MTFANFVLIFIALFLVLLVVLVRKLNDTEKVVIKQKDPLPLTLEEKSEDCLKFFTELVFVNEGNQCATIMDAVARSQLPYEQYDALEVRAKAEREGYPREDDYFEAVLIQKQGSKDDRLTMRIKIMLKPRKGMSLAEAVADMPDLPVDLIYQETGRRVAHYNKLRLLIKAESVAALVGVKLATKAF